MAELFKVPLKFATVVVMQMTDVIGEYITVHKEEVEYSGPWALCDRAAQKAAKDAADTAKTTGAGYGSSATSTAGTLTPVLTKMATNPTGMTPEEKNAELVAGEQGAGGATAGVTGAAGLAANRSNNTGAL